MLISKLKITKVSNIKIKELISKSQRIYEY